MNNSILSQSFWQQHVNRCRGEGLSQAAYCRQHDLVTHQFGYWYRKLTNQASASWLPVEIKQAPVSASPIELVLSGGRMLRLSNGFDAGLLKQIIVAVEATP